MNYTARSGWLNNKKLIRIGIHRYIIYDNELSILDNIRLIFSKVYY